MPLISKTSIPEEIILIIPISFLSKNSMIVRFLDERREMINQLIRHLKLKVYFFFCSFTFYYYLCNHY